MSFDAGAVSDHLCVVWSQIPRLKASMSASRRLFLEEPLALLPFCRTLLLNLPASRLVIVAMLVGTGERTSSDLMVVASTSETRAPSSSKWINGDVVLSACSRLLCQYIFNGGFI
jgi:hypothetical protein